MLNLLSQSVRRSAFLATLFFLLVASHSAVLPADEPTTPTKVEAPRVDKAALPDVSDIFAGGIPTTIDELRAMQARQLEITERVTPCTVGVRVGAAQGSGVIISPDGYVLTAAHVSGTANRNCTFILHDGRMVRGKTLGLNRTLDAGLMKINTIIRDGEEVEWPFVEVGLSNDLKPGQWCLATGHPGGYKRGRPPVVRVGRILSNRDNVMVTDCKLVGGDSGGPLFDMSGKVIGIHSRIGSALVTNMHVPVNIYMDSWDRMVASKEWGSTPGSRPVIGVRGDPDSPHAKVARVFPGSPADKSGIKVGDIITSFGGERVSDFSSLKSMIDGQAVGDSVKLSVRRGDETIELQLTIGKVGD